MANSHFSVKPVRRSQGDSAVAGAAYRIAGKLVSARDGRTIDMTKKHGVLHSEIMAPANAPARLIADAQTLWNEVERCETRCDARLAREAEFSLPRELTPEQNLTLARAIIEEQFVRRGMIAHFAIHDEWADGISKPHVHCLLTLRRVDENGFSKRKERDWDAVELLHEWRAGWAASTNRALALAGHEDRVDHRSYRARGIDLEPQPKLGRALRDAAGDGRDHVQQRAAEYQAVRERNADRLLVQPSIAFDYLTSQRSTFTLHELERFVAARTLSEDQYEDTMLLALASPELVRLPRDEQGRERFSSRAETEREETLLRCGGRLVERGTHGVAEELVEQAIALSPQTLNEGQANAIRYLTQPRGLVVLEGYAGTGKSSVAGTARLAWESQGYRVVGGALANTAADALTTGSKIPSRTIHSWLHAWKRGADRLTARDVFVIDEAGMLGTKQCAELVQYVRAAGAKLVLIGDTHQLPAIDPGAPMRLLAERFGSERLTTIVRQHQDWQRELTLQFANNETAAALQTYYDRGCVSGHATTRSAVAAMIESWDSDRHRNPSETALLLAFRRVDVRSLNEFARQKRQDAGELGVDMTLETPRGARKFAVGDRIVFYKTDRRDLQVTNGTLGTIEWRKDERWVVRLDDQRQIEVDTRHYDSIDHGYAGTLHKAQCATVDRAYILASEHLNAASVYVGMSRHRKDAHLYFSEEDFGDAPSLIRRISRVKFEPMVHELDVLRAERLAQSFGDEELFVKLPLDKRVEVLSTLEQAVEQKPKSLAQAFAALAKVQAAEREQREAALRLTTAKQALAEYRSTRPAFEKWRVRTSELESQVADACTELEKADKVLVQLRADPALQRAAQVRSQALHERADALHKTWRRLLRTERRHTSGRQLDHWIRAENARQGRVLMRAATQVDEGRQFDIERTEKNGGVTLLVLRDRTGGPLIVAHASHCSRESSSALARFQWRTPARSNEPPRPPRNALRGRDR